MFSFRPIHINRWKAEKNINVRYTECNIPASKTAAVGSTILINNTANGHNANSTTNKMASFHFPRKCTSFEKAFSIAL